jgi:hypothetical protein
MAAPVFAAESGRPKEQPLKLPELPRNPRAPDSCAAPKRAAREALVAFGKGHA